MLMNGILGGIILKNKTKINANGLFHTAYLHRSGMHENYAVERGFIVSAEKYRPRSACAFSPWVETFSYG